MSDPKFQKPTARPQVPPVRGAPAARPTAPPPAKPAAAETKPAAPASNTSGRVVHDERGNAVWDWVKETSRIAIESTTRMLKKLEAPELTVEDSQEEELRIMPDPGKGSGYDPYNQATKPRKPLKR
jgi:hypothetical protein